MIIYIYIEVLQVKQGELNMAPKIDIPTSAPTSSRIEITRLPKKVQTKMLIFDKDNNGHIDSKNKRGVLHFLLVDIKHNLQ